MEEAAASVFSIQMTIEVTCSSEILEPTYQTVWQDVPENYNLNTSCNESIKWHSFKVVYNNLWRGHPIVLIN